jgi:hypothetical protein
LIANALISRSASAALSLLLSLASLAAQEVEEKAIDTNPPDSKVREFANINPQDQVPTVRAIVPMDGANVFFLNHRGQIGVAKFSPGLSQIGWQLYSDVKLNALPFIALGPKYSVVTASQTEVTQSFDTNRDVSLDFFQALVTDWPGRNEGVNITAGPVADANGRLLFALAPFATTAGEPAKARIVAWHPGAKGLVTVTESELQIDTFAVNRTGLLAARLQMPDYRDGYFLSLTDLPPFSATAPDEAPAVMPVTRPSLVIPADLTGKSPPTQICFSHEEGREKILLTCPASKRLIEVIPEHSGAFWTGSFLLRAKLDTSVETLVEMTPGVILGGGDNGFIPLTDGKEVFRILRIALAADGIVLDFNQPVDRSMASLKETYAVKALSGAGNNSIDIQEIVIESDGRTLVLKTGEAPVGSVIRVACEALTSEKGETLLSPEAFYTVSPAPAPAPAE